MMRSNARYGTRSRSWRQPRQTTVSRLRPRPSVRPSASSISALLPAPDSPRTSTSRARGAGSSIRAAISASSRSRPTKRCARRSACGRACAPESALAIWSAVGRSPAPARAWTIRRRAPAAPRGSPPRCAACALAVLPRQHVQRARERRRAGDQLVREHAQRRRPSPARPRAARCTPAPGTPPCRRRGSRASARPSGGGARAPARIEQLATPPMQIAFEEA